eukprot:scaffold14.g1079.t1
MAGDTDRQGRHFRTVVRCAPGRILHHRFYPSDDGEEQGASDSGMQKVQPLAAAQLAATSAARPPPARVLPLTAQQQQRHRHQQRRLRGPHRLLRQQEQQQQDDELTLQQRLEALGADYTRTEAELRSELDEVNERYRAQLTALAALTDAARLTEVQKEYAAAANAIEKKIQAAAAAANASSEQVYKAFGLSNKNGN